MIDSIYIAMTGLLGYQKGLRVISNDTANLNTPGFKGTKLFFADLFYSADPTARDSAQYGNGLSTLGTAFDFHEGDLQNTGNSLDLAVDGQGFFVLRDSSDRIRYTRGGQFKFDADGFLVTASTGEKVMALDDSKALRTISISDVGTDPALPTGTIAFRGNIDSAGTTHTLGNVTVVDRTGTSHSMSVRFDAVTGSAGTWTVTLLDGMTSVGAGQIVFMNGLMDAAHSKVSMTYAPAGQEHMPLELDFSNAVTAFASGGNQSTIAVASQDGRAAGYLAGTTFDETGTLVLSYSNGRTVKNARLALGRFNSPDVVSAAGNNEFEAKDPRGWQIGVAEADGFGKVHSGTLEMSNVDLSQEFSALVIMQRGYQASSQVVSTANDMINELFGVRGR
jgi:flagellar hook protein FlgE